MRVRAVTGLCLAADNWQSEDQPKEVNRALATSTLTDKLAETSKNWHLASLARRTSLWDVTGQARRFAQPI
jgi:hypothetical protein